MPHRRSWKEQGIRRGLVAILCCLGPMVAFAQRPDQSSTPDQRFLPAPGQIFYLDLDSAAGTFSQWRHDDLRAFNSLRAVMRVLRTRKDSKWGPSFTIGLRSDDNPNNANDLRLRIAGMDGKRSLDLQLVGSLNGKQIQPIPLKTAGNLNEVLKVQIDWKSQDIVVFRVGETESRAIKIGWQVCSAMITGSTGQLKVDSIIFGVVSP